MKKYLIPWGRIGGANIAMGIICIVVGVSVGVLSIICGSKLLNDKKICFFSACGMNKRKRTMFMCPFLLFGRLTEY